ncbi:hypothetical protein, partial [Flavivirga aquatica]|uniref:hypothetical protein n=1 Tax=Flavivirga aquatica TaxID=1849968 RepID=UPI00196A5CCB
MRDLIIDFSKYKPTIESAMIFVIRPALAINFIPCCMPLCVLRCFGKQFGKIDYEQQTVIEMRGSFFFRNELDKENQEGLTQR